MVESIWVRAYRLGFGVLALAAIGRSYVEDGGSFANFASKFTYQSNLLSGVVLIVGAVLTLASARSLRWDLVRGATVMYGITTFLVYGVLVNTFTNPFDPDVPWTNTVLHQIMPVVLVLDLLIRPLAHRVPWRLTLLWSAYPLAYLAYSLVRGAITGWYPYDFLDPGEAGGYPGVAAYSVAILIGFLAIGLLVGAIGRWRHRPTPTRLVPPEGT